MLEKKVEGDIKSPCFSFINYKINSVDFSIPNKITLIKQNIQLSDDDIIWSIGFSDPTRLPSSQGKGFEYLIPVCMSFTINNHKEEIAKGKFSITGYFKSEDVEKGDEAESILVLRQGPALLFPYLRSIISTVLSQAGLNIIVPPLINMIAIGTNAEGRNIIDIGENYESNQQYNS